MEARRATKAPTSIKTSVVNLAPRSNITIRFESIFGSN